MASRWRGSSSWQLIKRTESSFQQVEREQNVAMEKCLLGGQKKNKAARTGRVITCCIRQTLLRAAARNEEMES